jgi:Archaeal fructose-1,6-bisphosphatase and related enzymes of inositol monophosphatase family
VDHATQADLIRVAHLLANTARPVTLAHFRTASLVADTKALSHFDPVTIADRAAEQAMRDVLARERPDDGIFGEEYGQTLGTSGLTWVLDPIDGTRGYISGTPTWGVLIAVGDADGPVYGIIDQPYIGERFAGGFGQADVTGPMGTAPLATRAPRGLDQAICCPPFPKSAQRPKWLRFRPCRVRCG